MKKITVLSLVLLLLLPVVLLGCEGDPIREEFYMESIHLTGQTVGTPPLKIDAGELLTTPEAGAMEYDGTGIYLTNINHRRFISQAADSIITSQTVVNTADETTIFTGVLNANELRVHRVYRLSLYGQLSTASASDTLTVRIKVNGTTAVTLESKAGAVSEVPWYGWTTITVRETGAAGDLSAHGYVNINEKIGHDNNTSIAIDTTSINNIVATLHWSAAKIGNTARLDQAFLEVLD